MQTTVKTKTVKLVQMAILTAITLILTFTPLGYLRIGVVEMTLIVIPVAIAAIVVGPLGGAVLGGIFGVTSYLLCLMGLSTFGTFMLNLNPWLFFIVSFVPRVLCGLLAGLIFRALQKIDKTRIVSFLVASLSAALFNTIFYVGALILFFWNNEAFISGMEITGSIGVFIIAFVGLNGLVEAIVNFIVGAGLAKVMARISKRFI